ncbi:ABC transporter ATP-binding protein [Gulosibacter sp. 10]|uniref:ABC transporter ATP-binding protein n=1 Tax=Gulosibacter sp. 10 TaxID=1255570 RepID=UPI00097EA3DD|nr:ABC transporter ATP-binding protein [Gulosibacter sp. 10]SJM61594.1 ABC transporter ATP-binding protein [Gulosibacter sp. 10]
MTTRSDAQKRDAGKAALAELLKPVRGRLLLGRALGLCSGLLAIAPYIALVRLGEVLVEAEQSGVPADPEQIRDITTVLVSAFIGQLFFLAIGLAVTHFADLKLSGILRDRIIDRISRAPLSWFSDTTSGRVRKAVQDDTKTLHTLVAHAPVEITVAIVTPLALLIYAFVIDWRLGLLAIGTLPVYFGIQAIGYRGMGEKTAEMDTKLGEVSATAVEFAEGIGVVKAFGQVGRAHARYERAARAFSEFYLAWVGPLLKISSISEAIVSVPVLLLVNILGGTLLVQGGYVGVADVLATSLIALVIPMTMQVIGRNAMAYQLAGNASLRLTEILDTPELPMPEGAESSAADRDRSVLVEFDGVSFSYGATRALSGIDLRLEPGSITALIGASGSGKSTLAGLLGRFHDPDEGAVRCNGTDIRTLSGPELYSTVSFVLQDPQLLRISLRDNIRLARPDASEAEVRDAAAAAHVLDELERIPGGLDAVVGEDAKLSGGQAQRVAIARALLADAPVLLLDEATAATDPDAEAEIQAALNRLVAGRTVLVIAHRPESVLGVDQLVHLEDGRITTRLAGDSVTAEAIRSLMRRTPAAAATAAATATAATETAAEESSRAHS